MMLIRLGLYLASVLVRAFESTLAWIVLLMDSLVVTCGRRMVVEVGLWTLGWIDRFLLFGKRYLEGVRTALKYRLYFEAVTAPMRTRYRALKRK
jgi:hypothetical protein